MSSLSGKVIDGHVHVGLLGDAYPQWGQLSSHFQRQIGFKIFLAYARIKPDQLCDRVLMEATLQVIEETAVDRVVCLALDPVYTEDGTRCPELSHLWVDNEYVIELGRKTNKKILLGASVHPCDRQFVDRVKYCVDNGAVLIKWLPSAQSIDLAKLPEEHLLFGSDFPTPIFELSADLKEMLEDFKAVLAGDLGRVLIPEDNLLDVNYRELSAAFPGHPLFTNFGKLCDSLGIGG